MSAPFIGEIKIFPYNFAPRNWAFCDGQILPISQNTALFSILGTTYGGNGRTDFALPNLQGRAPIHQGTGPGLTNRRIGSVGGAATETLTSNQIGSHTHTMRAINALGNNQSPAGQYPAADPPQSREYIATAPNTSLAATTITSTGGGGAHDNLQPYLVLNFCIALNGIFPSRN